MRESLNEINVEKNTHIQNVFRTLKYKTWLEI